MENNAISKKINACDRRIAIIGAGAAGLTTADALRDKGYTHVTLFERSDHAGGKCSTVDFDGKLYELGAGIVEENNTTVIALAKKYDVRMQRVEFGRSMVVSREGTPVPKHTLIYMMSLVKEVIRYRRLSRIHHTITQPGFSQIDTDLCIPFSSWAKKNGLEKIAKEFALYFTGFGYDYFERIPAAYVLKYYSWKTVKAFAKRAMFQFPDGIQHIWTMVARAHDVLYNTHISHIERTSDGVTMTVSTGDSTSPEQYYFDELIITSPLDEAILFLDAHKQEKELFSQIQYVDYRTIACEVTNFPKVTGYCPGNFSVVRVGHPIFWYHRHLDTNIYTFYVFGDEHMSDDTVVKNVSQFIHQMGGTCGTVRTIARWKYFPHVSSDVMKHGFFDKVEALQGSHHTYYAGELFNFSTVGLTSQYAHHVVERYF